MTLSGGEVYVGEYENHKENGIILYNRGNKWSGYKAADGKVIGSSAGRWTAYKDGSEYCGPIIERRRGNTIYRVKEGFGEYCFPDDDSECPSDRYLGQFKDASRANVVSSKRGRLALLSSRLLLSTIHSGNWLQMFTTTWSRLD